MMNTGSAFAGAAVTIRTPPTSVALAAIAVERANFFMKPPRYLDRSLAS
jgi:hypothetical protein